MKKITSILYAFLMGGCIFAQMPKQSALIYHEDTVKNYLCLVDDDTKVDSMCIDVQTWAIAKDTTHYWSTGGDLTIIGSKNDSIVYFSSKGAGKGSLYFTYYTEGCGNFSIRADFYKDFYPSKYDLQIQGPDCILKGDTVVYSVDPIFTKNLGDMIGIDNYYWNLTQSSKPSFVDTIIYVSGDGSSVTFVVDEVSGNDSIVVNFGRCNQTEDKAIVKYLGKAAPKPEVDAEVCISASEQEKQLVINNPIENVIYSWSCSDDLWSIVPSTGTSVTLKTGNNAAPVVTVTSYYEGGEACSASKSTIQVRRSWGRNVSITAPTMPYIYDNKYTFEVVGTITGGGLTWIAPTGWDLTAKNGTTATFSLSYLEDMQLVDTLFAMASNSCAGAEVDNTKMAVFVKPAKVKTIDIPTCLTVGETYTFHITDWENGPKSSKYEWYVNEVKQNNYEGDSLVYVAAAGDSTISVKPLGATNTQTNKRYDGDTTLVKIAFNATAPKAILAANCIPTGMRDTIRFTLSNTTANQYYEWELPTGMDSINSDMHNTWMDIETNGVPDDYIIKVKGIGSGNCNDSEWKKDTFTINEPLFSIATEVVRNNRNFYIDPWDLENIDTYQWYVDNIYVDNSNEISIPKNTPSAFVEVYITFNDGCRQYASLNFTSSANAPLRNLRSSNIGILSNAEKLLLSPNPANNIVQVEFPYADGGSVVYIVDLNGRILYRKSTETNKINIPIENLSIGVYSVVVKQNKQRYSERLIINK